MEKTIYLDHNTLIYVVERNDKDINNKVREIIESKKFSFVFSLWNLFEIAKGNATQAQNLAKYVDNLKPLWFIPSPPIYHLEVKKFIYTNYYKNEDAKLLNPFCRFLSEALTYLPEEPTEIGVSALAVVRNYINNPSLILKITNLQKLTIPALQILRQAKRKNKLKEREKEIFNKQIRLYLPKQDPLEQPINNNTQEELLNYCYRNKSKFYSSCPIFAIESSLMDFRISDPNRNPSEQDSIDLQHQILALTYVDYFITNDGFITSGSQYVEKNRSKLKIAVTYRSILDIPL